MLQCAPDRKSGSAGMPRPISYAVFCLKKKELAQQGHPVELVWHGATITTTMWGVAKNAPNRKLAWEFLQFAVQAKPQADFANRLFYGPTNPDAFKYVSAEVARQLPT